MTVDPGAADLEAPGLDNGSLARQLRRSTLVRGHDRQDLLDPLAWLEDLGQARPFLAQRGNDCLVLAVNHLGRQPQCGDALRHVIDLSRRRICFHDHDHGRPPSHKVDGVPGIRL